MRVLIFGSRSLTWRHLDVFFWLAQHALLADEVPLDEFMADWLKPGGSGREWRWLPDDEPIVLLNGDGPPGKERGAIGADKLALLACMKRWPERRRVRWFDQDQRAAMVAAKPQRVYCCHTDLEASETSAGLAGALKMAGIPFWLVTVKPSGEVVSVEVRR